jgi:hypothetical protein
VSSEPLGVDLLPTNQEARRPSVTFKEYVSARRAGHDASGDFVRLALADPAFPDIASWSELTAYVERGAGYEAVEAGRRVLDEY